MKDAEIFHNQVGREIKFKEEMSINDKKQKKEKRIEK